MQTLITLIIIILSLAYAAWRIYKAVGNTTEDPCAGCDGCPMREEMRRKSRKGGTNISCEKKKAV